MRLQPEYKIKAEDCDFEKMQNIVSALDYLRQEAKKTGVEDVEDIVNSAFNMLLAAYTIILRHAVGADLFDSDETE